MAPSEVTYSYVQLTFFHSGKHNVFVWESDISLEKCAKRQAEDINNWEMFGEHTFVRMVRFLCLPRRNLLP